MIVDQSTARLQLKPEPLTRAHVDGAWWPRSLDLATELPALLELLSGRLGPAALVVFDVDAWDDSPRRIEVGGNLVRLEGFSSAESDTLSVIGTHGQRICLRVVPPDTAGTAAHQTLADSSVPDVTSSPNSDSMNGAAERALDEVAALLTRHDGKGDGHRTATITRLVDETAEQFVGAPVQSFVPILVEHIVRNQLSATKHAG